MCNLVGFALGFSTNLLVAIVVASTNRCKHFPIDGGEPEETTDFVVVLTKFTIVSSHKVCCLLALHVRHCLVANFGSRRKVTDI